MRETLWHGSDAELSETALAQPVLFVAEYALAVLWMSWGVHPAAMLGHSIGEYVAAHLAGVFSLEDALMLVTARGRLMQGMAAGNMLAVRLSPADLRQRLSSTVEIAAVNAPGLCSVSGTRDAIEALALELERDGIEHRPLHTSHAFHSAMMEPALAPFREIVSRVPLSAPRLPLVSNVTGTWLTPQQATSPDYWTSHLRNAVLFADGVATLAADPTLQLLEVGPGNALTALARLSLGRDGAARVSASLPHPREARSETDTMLSAAGRLWANGVLIDWDAMHASETLHRVPLPTYPFERKRHWVEAPTEVPAASGTFDASSVTRREPLDHWFFAPSWSRVPDVGRPGSMEQGTWLVFGGSVALEQELRAQLAARGGDVVLMRAAATGSVAERDGAYEVRQTEAADYDAVLRDLKHRGKQLRGIIHLANLGPVQGVSESVAVLHEIMALASAVASTAGGSPLRVVVVTSDAQSVLGEPIVHPERALLSGPVLVLPVEADGVSASLLDFPGGDDAAISVQELARQILYEASSEDGEQFVARRGGQRWVRRYTRVVLAAASGDELPLKRQAHYLITGGLGGIGLTLAEWLAKTVQARLTLTSRTPMPPREAWAPWLEAHPADDDTSVRISAVMRIEDAGGAVSLAVADASDESAMQRALDTSEPEFGPVAGVVHAAGTLGSTLLAVSTPDAVDACVRAKVDGTQVLRRLLGHRPLDFVMLCSSISAVAGFAGSAAYGAGNAYLDAFATSASSPAGWHVVSIGWAGWREVGIATRLGPISAERAALVAAGIGPSEGIEAFSRVLAARVTQLVVSPFDIETGQLRHRRHVTQANGRVPDAAVVPESRSVSEGVTLRPSQSSGKDELTGDIEQRLVAIWQDLLGVSNIGVHDNFFELGGHSLMATRVIARIDNHFGVRLPLRELFGAPTLRQLSELVAAQLQQVAVPSSAPDDGEREEFEL